MNYQTYFLSILFLVCIVTGCNITYKVRNQKNDIEYMLYTPCGKAKVELVGKGNSKFTLKQEFSFDNSADYLPDALQIRYNGKEILPEFNKRVVQGGSIKLEDKMTIEASFDLDESVFDGDTILVFSNEYVRCNETVIVLDTLIYSFVNNLRIYGVNDK